MSTTVKLLIEAGSRIQAGFAHGASCVMYGWRLALDLPGNKTWITKTLKISLQVTRFVV